MSKVNLIKSMKENIAKSGSSKKEVLYFAPDSVKRVRFLQELDEGYMIPFHSDFNAKIYEPCKDPEDHENCENCKDEISILENYCWSVWDYDSNAVRIICMKASGISFIPSLIELFEEYGTITDRDYKIKKTGKGTGSSFTVTPLDKSRFRNKAKAYSENEIVEILNKAFVSSKDDDDDDEVEAKPKKKKSVRSKFEELDFEDLKEICITIGYSKKDLRQFEDEGELIDDLFDNYEEADLKELIDEYENE